MNENGHEHFPSLHESPSGETDLSQAWAYLEKFRSKWYVACRKRTRNWAEAVELYHDAVIPAVIEAAPKYDESRASLYTFMECAITNRLNTHAQYSKYRQHESLLSASHQAESNDCIEDVDLLDALEELQAAFPDAYRVFYGHYVLKQTKSLLMAKYRVTYWAVEELLELGRNFLRKELE